MPNNAEASDIQAVARVAQICALFTPETTELSAADVAERTGLNRTTAYRYCASMAAAGILERGVRRGTFALGPLMLGLGAIALGRKRVVEVGRPYLRKLSSALRLTAVLSVAGTAGPVVTLVEEDTSRTVVVTVRAGTQLDTTAAQTLVFLAFGAPETVGGWAPGKPRQVKAAREQGYAVVRQKEGPFVVAAPVFDATGLAATMAVLGAGDLADPSPTVETLQRWAKALSTELGGPA